MYIYIFEYFPHSDFLAVVLIPATSLPAQGSDTAKQFNVSPNKTYFIINNIKFMNNIMEH